MSVLVGVEVGEGKAVRLKFAKLGRGLRLNVILIQPSSESPSGNAGDTSPELLRSRLYER